MVTSVAALERNYQKTLALFFLSVLAMTFLGSFVSYDPYHENFQENRVLAKPPCFREILDFKNFTKKTDAYFSDNFGLRKILLRYFFFFKMKILRSDLNQRLIGNDGWMFLREEIPDYMRTNLFTKKELDRISNNLSALEQYYRKRNILFAFLSVPDKHSIYPEFMPAYLSILSPQNRIDQLMAAIDSKRPGLIIDVRDELVEQKNKGYTVYYPWGTHWTALGALIAWEKIEKVISHKKSDMNWVNGKVEINSRLINKYEEDGWIHYAWPHDQLYKVPNIICNKPKELSKNSISQKRVKLIIAGDSFAHDYMGGMAYAFVDDYKYLPFDTKPEEILSYNPDIVILERAERFPDFLLSLKLPNDNIISDIVKTGKIISPQPKEFVLRSDLSINGDDKEILFEHAPGKVDYEVKIPAQSSLDFSIGMVPGCWSPDKGDGVLFRILINENKAEKIIFNKYIDPKNITKDRKWHDFSIDLTSYSGKNVILSFITLPGLEGSGGNAFDWSAWGNIKFQKND